MEVFKPKSTISTSSETSQSLTQQIQYSLDASTRTDIVNLAEVIRYEMPSIEMLHTKQNDEATNLINGTSGALPAETSGYSVVMSRLWALTSIGDDEEDDRQKPTDYAFERTTKLLERAAFLRDGDIPRGAVTTMGDGGVRIYWNGLRRKLRLVIAPEVGGNEYIYHSQGADYDVERTVTPDTLNRWLDWFLQG